jgi:hypothetical protein
MFLSWFPLEVAAKSFVFPRCSNFIFPAPISYSGEKYLPAGGLGWNGITAPFCRPGFWEKKMWKKGSGTTEMGAPCFSRGWTLQRR